ncbi:MAG: metallophosphoesterase [Clostridiales bacterium]|nr:metallophosphoesterase [Clostridiales bacterium]
MRILVVSDTHRDAYVLQKAVNQQPGAQVVIHLGDGADEAEELSYRYPEKQVLFVRGNCDFASDAPAQGLIMLEGRRILYTHGHLYQVKFGEGALLEEAQRQKADIVLYGHTHHAVTAFTGGIYLMNPGSLGRPDEKGRSYGIIDITPSGIMTNIVPLR